MIIAVPMRLTEGAGLLNSNVVTTIVPLLEVSMNRLMRTSRSVGDVLSVVVENGHSYDTVFGMAGGCFSSQRRVELCVFQIASYHRQ